MAVLVLAALIHHILVFHPFLIDQTFDDHRYLSVSDIETYSVLTDDGDALSVNDRRGISSPILDPAVGAFSKPLFHKLLLNSSADHPPKT